MSIRTPSHRVAGLILTTPPALTEQPAAVYLAGLSPGSQRTMRQALDVMARILSDGRADALMLDWAVLRYKHTAAVRAVLVQKYATMTSSQFLDATAAGFERGSAIGTH